MSSPRRGPPNAAFESPIRRAQDQEKLLAETAHIPVLLDGLVIDDAQIFNNKLREWEDYYNYHRPHGGLNGQTPYERLRQKTQTPALTDERQSHTFKVGRAGLEPATNGL
jgi:transposase InsO family protein